jgi:hypothetical protein
MLVRPPARSSTRQDRPARQASLSRAGRSVGDCAKTGSGQSPNAEATSGSIVIFGPVNQCFTDTCQ